MTLPDLIPDGERIVSTYLRDQLALVDELAPGIRVVGKTPDAIDEPWIRLTQLDAPDPIGDPAARLIAFYVQAECYAGDEDDPLGGQPGAKLIARWTRAALFAMPDLADPDDAVVTSSKVTGHSRLPDTQIEPARERVVITADVYMRAA